MYDPSPQASTSAAGTETAAFAAGQPMLDDTDAGMPRTASPEPHHHMAQLHIDPQQQQQQQQRQFDEANATRRRSCGEPQQEDLEVAAVAQDAEATEWRQRQNSLAGESEQPPEYAP